MSDAATVPDARVRFAAERTLLAWVRTGIALMGFGFVLARFSWFLRQMAIWLPAPDEGQAPAWSLALGIALIALGAAVNTLAAVEHRRFLTRHDAGLPYLPPRRSLGILLAYALTALGVVTMAYLVLIRR